MDWQRDETHMLHNGKFTCKNSLVVHGTPRNFCEYYDSFSSESDNMNANCANGYCVSTSEYYRCVCNEGKFFCFVLALSKIQVLYRTNMVWSVSNPKPSSNQIINMMHAKTRHPVKEQNVLHLSVE